MENKKEATRSQWQKHFEKCSAGGTSQAVYCEKNGLCLSTFQYWKRYRWKNTDSRPAWRGSGFIEFPALLIEPPGTDSARPVIEITRGIDFLLKGGFEIDLSRIPKKMLRWSGREKRFGSEPPLIFRTRSGGLRV